MAAGLPDDLVLEYDLLQFVDSEDGASGFLDPPSCPNAAFNVDDLLGNCSVGVSVSTEAEVAAAHGEETGGAISQADCLLLSSLDASDPIDKRGAVHEPGANAADDDVSAFIMDGEAFLREMEKVVKLDDKSASELEKKPCSCYCPDGHCVCGAVDIDAFTDVDVLSSPCPSSTCPSSNDNGSPCRSDLGDIHIDCPILKDVQATNAWLAASAAARPTALPPAAPSPHPVLLSHQSSSSLSTASIHSSPIDLTTDDSCADESEDMDASNDEEDAAEKEPLKSVAEDHDDEEMTEEDAQHDAELLQKEATYLEAQYDYLVSRAKSSRPQRASIKTKRRGRDNAVSAENKQQLAKSTKENSTLTELVAQQKNYMDNFKAMLAFAPVNDVRMALMTPIESYIHLGKDFDERRKTILALREEKLDMTYKYIEQKAQGLDLNQPYQFSDTFEKFGKQYCVNFAISKYEGVSVFQVARAIYEQIAGKDDSLCQSMGRMTIRESYDSIKCNFMHQRIISSMKWEDGDEELPELESNALFYSRFGDNSAVMATDYIDQDDLHPYQPSSRMRKDVSSGVVLTGHTDEKGNKYVIMKRYLMAKYHLFPHKMSAEQQERLFSRLPMCHETMKTLIVDKIARNDASSACPSECLSKQTQGVAVQQ